MPSFRVSDGHEIYLYLLVLAAEKQCIEPVLFVEEVIDDPHATGFASTF